MRVYNNSIVLKFDTTSTGNAGSGQSITVRQGNGFGTGDKASLFDADSNSIDNPVFADSDGNYSFAVADGVYDLVYNEDLPSKQVVAYESIFDFENMGFSEESIVLTESQTTVDFVKTNIGSVFISGDEIDDGQLLPDTVDGSARKYNFVSSQQLVLDRTYPAGTVVTNAGLPVSQTGVYNIPSVFDYGAFNDPTGAVDQYSEFQTAADANANKIVMIPPGKYRIGSLITTNVTWYIMPGVEFSNLPGVPPSFVFDLTQLGGNVMLIRGEDSFGNLYVGDGSYTVQKESGRAQTTGAVVGASPDGQNGVGGYTHTSVKTGNDQGAIAVKGVALNDQESFGVTAWGAYIEGVRTENAGGITHGIEAAAINYGTEVDFTPSTLVTEAGGLTNSYWGSAGIGGSASEADVSVALGFIAQPSGSVSSAKYLRGLVFQEGALRTGEMVAGTSGEEVSWYDARARTGEKLSYISGANQGGNNGRVAIGTRNNGVDEFIEYNFSYDKLGPNNDGVVDLASAGERFNDGYFVNTPIGTSDENEKEQITTVEDKLLLVGKELLSKKKKWKWKSAVGEKGNNARWHVGPTAQDVEAAFSKQGIDASEYGMFIKSEILDSNDEPTGEYRLGLRHTEVQYLMLMATGV